MHLIGYVHREFVSMHCFKMRCNQIWFVHRNVHCFLDNSMNSVLDNRRLSTELLRWVAGSDRGTVLVFGPEHSQYMAPVMSKNESPIQGLETNIFSDERILLLVSMLLGIVVLTVGFQVLIPLGQVPKARSHWSLPFTEVPSESAQDVTTHSNRKDGP